MICKIEDSGYIEVELEKLILDKNLREHMGLIESEFLRNNFEEKREFEKVESI